MTSEFRRQELLAELMLITGAQDEGQAIAFVKEILDNKEAKKKLKELQKR